MALYRGMRWAKQETAGDCEHGDLYHHLGRTDYVRFLGFAELPDAFSAWMTRLK
jgi:hypothetical protein